MVTTSVQGLTKGYTYELRVNWPSTNPGKFTIWTDHHSQATSSPIKHKQQLRRRRQLLNAHKELFTVETDTSSSSSSSRKENGKENSNSKINGDNQDYYCHVHVEKEGISWDPELEERAVPFILIVERIHFYVLPESSIPLVLMLLFLIVVGVLFVIPKVNKAIEDDVRKR
jgi:hypothetical protein